MKSAVASYPPSAPYFKSLLALAAAAPSVMADEPRLNQIQVIGSHNSYHLAPPSALRATIGKFHPEAADAWSYSHPSLTTQLSTSGVRQFELDLYADTKGGRFADPLGLKLANLAGAKLPPFDPAGLMKQPGFKILHVPDVDCWSNTPTLAAALTELAAWSDGHPGHLPVLVLIECEDQAHPPLPATPEPFTRERLLELDAAISAVIPRSKLLVPDDVRGGGKTLREAILKSGWPEITAIRGKFLFALDNTTHIRDLYLQDNPTLENRILFVHAPDAGHPAAAWFKLNDPVKDFDEIQRLVKQGFLVRTRADETGPDAAKRERAFASGAQWISADHFAAGLPAADRVAFPNGAMARPNPVSGGKIETVDP